MFSLIKASLFRSNDLLINYSPPLLLFLHSKKKKAGSIYPLFNHIKKLRSFYSDIYPLTQVNRVRSGPSSFHYDTLFPYYYTKEIAKCQTKSFICFIICFIILSITHLAQKYWHLYKSLSKKNNKLNEKSNTINNNAWYG